MLSFSVSGVTSQPGPSLGATLVQMKQSSFKAILERQLDYKIDMAKAMLEGFKVL